MQEIEAQPVEKPKRSPVWKLVFYFVGLFLFGKTVSAVFTWLSGTAWLQQFPKFSQIVMDALDVTRSQDDVITTIWSLILTAILVLPVGWVYTYTKAREGYDRALVQTLIVMGMVVCGMMMLIQDQFSRALALVGVVSAVRFRTNLRDPKDAVFVLISIGIGMGTGLHVTRVASWLTVIMCAAFLVMHKFKIGEQPGEEEFMTFETKKKDKDKDKKKDKEKKKDKKKDKDEDAGAAAWAPTSLERLERIAKSLTDHRRGVKRPNVAIVLHALDADAAMGYVHNVLDRYKAPWHLVTYAPGPGATTLEYMVRIEGEGDPLAALARDIEGSCGTTVQDVEVRFIPHVSDATAEVSHTVGDTTPASI